MRWIKPERRYGDLCQRQKFLWFPKTLNGETRWLETARIEYLYRGYYSGWLAENWVPRPADVTPQLSNAEAAKLQTVFILIWEQHDTPSRVLGVFVSRNAALAAVVPDSKVVRAQILFDDSGDLTDNK